jgi:hypothetical protein
VIENFITQFTDSSLVWRYVNFPAFMLIVVLGNFNLSEIIRFAEVLTG